MSPPRAAAFPQEFRKDRQGAAITAWKDELAPFYDQAKRMLGVNEYPYFTPADKVMQETLP